MGISVVDCLGFLMQEDPAHCGLQYLLVVVWGRIRKHGPVKKPASVLTLLHDKL